MSPTPGLSEASLKILTEASLKILTEASIKTTPRV